MVEKQLLVGDVFSTAQGGYHLKVFLGFQNKTSDWVYDILRDENWRGR